MFDKKAYMKLYRKKYNVDQAPQISHARKLYYVKHKKRILVVQSKYQTQKRKTDLNYRISQNLRSRLVTVIRRQLGPKSIKTFDLIGCNIVDLRKHLQKQFKAKMSWDNYGLWEIDHIKPCAAFNLINVEEQKKCFHYTNLQPLWAGDNRRKSSKYLYGNQNSKSWRASKTTRTTNPRLW